MTNNNLPGVIFDMDGVIVDTNPVHKTAIREFLQRYDIELDESGLEQHVWGRRNSEWIPAAFGKPLSTPEIMRYGAEKELIFRNMYSNVKPLAGLDTFLESLHLDQYPLAIGTSAPVENLEYILEKTGFHKYFDVLLDESAVSKGKPDPEIYLKCSEELNRSPQFCLVFEDSLSGIASALEAGCKVVGVTTTHNKQELSECDLVIQDFHESDRILNFIRSL